MSTAKSRMSEASSTSYSWAFGICLSSTSTETKGILDSNLREAVHGTEETRVPGMVDWGDSPPTAPRAGARRKPPGRAQPWWNEGQLLRGKRLR